MVLWDGHASSWVFKGYYCLLLLLLLLCPLITTATYEEAGGLPSGVGGASFRGGMRSFILSSPFASSKLAILWFGENPASAKINWQKKGAGLILVCQI